ncbi:MAG: tetratricopeptide repeat protein [Candidatus Acidiferrales bacterium]
MSDTHSESHRPRRRWRLALLAAGLAALTALAPFTPSLRSAPQKNSSALQAEAALAGAQAAMDREDYATAAMLLESFLFVYPGHVGALFNLAYCYSLQDRTDDAIETYRQVLEVDPKMHSARQNLALLFLEAEKPAEAVAEFDQILEDFPNNYHAHFYRAQALETLGYKDKALPDYLRAAELDPEAAEPRRAALPLLLQKQDWSGAEAIVRQLLGISPGDTELALTLAELLVNQDKQADALAAYNQFLEVQAKGEPPSPSTRGEIHMRAGWLARKLGRTDEALRHFRRAREPAAAGGEYYAQASLVDEADTLASLQRWKEAIPLYEVAVKNKTDDAGLRAALGVAYLENHQYEPAAREFLAALRINPDEVENYNRAASALYLNGALAGAVEILERRATRADETRGTLFLRAISHDKLNQCGAAVTFYEKFLATNPDKKSDQYIQAAGRLRTLKGRCRETRR